MQADTAPNWLTSGHYSCSTHRSPVGDASLVHCDGRWCIRIGKRPFITRLFSADWLDTLQVRTLSGACGIAVGKMRSPNALQPKLTFFIQATPSLLRSSAPACLQSRVSMQALSLAIRMLLWHSQFLLSGILRQRQCARKCFSNTLFPFARSGLS
jgi:hypothetical protein